MSQAARDLVVTAKESPDSAELRKMALNLIAPGVANVRDGL